MKRKMKMANAPEQGRLHPRIPGERIIIIESQEGDVIAVAVVLLPYVLPNITSVQIGLSVKSPSEAYDNMQRAISIARGRAIKTKLNPTTDLVGLSTVSINFPVMAMPFSALDRHNAAVKTLSEFVESYYGIGKLYLNEVITLTVGKKRLQNS